MNTAAERRAELVSRMESHFRQARALRESASEHQSAGERFRRELQLLDTPELPNLFPPCASTENQQSPK